MEGFESLCDNTFAHVLAFLDFRSAVRLTKFTSKSLGHRVFRASNARTFHHCWKETFQRHYFSPLEEENNNDDDDDDDDDGCCCCSHYLTECHKRRVLLRNLVGGKKRRSFCFNLPNRFFFFVPVIPSDDDEGMEWSDPPPVNFDCPSFILTSPGTSGEMVFLNPFDGCVSIQESCRDNAIASDDAMMEQAMKDAATIIRQREHLGLEDLPDEHIAGAIIEDCVYRNHNMEHYKVEPTEVLLDMDDYFSIDLSDYFHFDNGRRRNEEDLFLGEDDEVEIDFIGVDVTQILNDELEITGTLIGVGRQFCKESEAWGEPQVCTELIAWRRLRGQEDYMEQFVCRFRWSYQCLAICSKYLRLYVGFPLGEGPFHRQDVDLVNNNETDRFDFQGGSRVVAVYPLLPYPEDDERGTEGGPKCFPRPLYVLKCRHPVSAVSVDPTGAFAFVGTTGSTIEVFETNAKPGSKRIMVLDVSRAIKKAKASGNIVKKADCPIRTVAAPVRDPFVHELDQNSNLPEQIQPSTQTTPAPAVIEFDEEVEHTANGSLDDLNQTVSSIHHPPHLSVEACGFVSLHHQHNKGSRLILWRKEKSPGYEVASMVDLPLSSRRIPKVHYDGRRLIVYGQDHIGMIILVYQVLSSWEDLDAFTLKSNGFGDESAGVRNFLPPFRIRFVNRIRHAALGGIDYESIFMTCNERFIVVNTKAGIHLGAAPSTDGLLVIDLNDMSD